MKREKSIKGEGNNESGDWNFVRENIVVTRTVLIIKFKRYIQKLVSLNCADDDFL